MLISDWSSDVCSSDLALQLAEAAVHHDVAVGAHRLRPALGRIGRHQVGALDERQRRAGELRAAVPEVAQEEHYLVALGRQRLGDRRQAAVVPEAFPALIADQDLGHGWGDGTRVGSGKSVSVSVVSGGRRIYKKTKLQTDTQ